MTDRGSYPTPSTKMGTTRRIVTGHNEKGLSIFESDSVLSPINPIASDGSAPHGLIPGFTTLARTQDVPDTSVNKPFVELHGKKLPLSTEEGVTCRTVDFPPVPAEVMTSDTVNFMHRTQSVDFGVVLEGTIWAVLDSGEQRELKAGDVCVQRGTNHAWQNRSNDNCKMLFVLVPSQPIINSTTGKAFELTDTSHLTDD